MTLRLFGRETRFSLDRNHSKGHGSSIAQLLIKDERVDPLAHLNEALTDATKNCHSIL